MAQSEDHDFNSFQTLASPKSMASSTSHSPAVTEDTHSEDDGHAILVTGAKEVAGVEEVAEVGKQLEQQILEEEEADVVSKSNSIPDADISNVDMFSSKTILKKLRVKDLLHPNPGKVKLWSKQVIIAEHKETVHCKLAILPNITDPALLTTSTMLSVISQLSDAQCHTMRESSKNFKLSVKCEVMVAGKAIEVVEPLLVPFNDHRIGQLRYFQKIVPNENLTDYYHESAVFSLTTNLHVLK